MRGFTLAVLVLVVGACSDSTATTSDGAVLPTTLPTATAPSTTVAPQATDTVPPPTTALPPLEIVQQELRDVELSDPPLRLLIAVPALAGPVDQEIQDQINQHLLDLVNSTEEAFVGNVTLYLDEVGEVEGPVSSLELFYDVRTLSPQLLSMRFDEVTFFQGAAIGGWTVHSLTVDLESGEVVPLHELFTGTEWAFALDFLIRQAVTDQVYDGDPTQLDAWVGPDDVLIPEDFALGPIGFEFSFQELAVGPAVIRAPTVTVPYASIGVYIDGDGLAGLLAEDAEVGCAFLAEFDAAKDRVFTSEIGSADEAAALEDATMWAAELKAFRTDLSGAIDLLLGWSVAFVDDPSTELTVDEMAAIESSNDILRFELDLCG